MAEIIHEGDIPNSNVHWALYDSGLLELVGSGSSPQNIPNFTKSSPPPWNSYVSDITSTSFDNIQKIGNYSFYQCINLKTVSIPSESYLGKYVFYDSGIEDLYIPGVTWLEEDYTLGGCQYLENIHVGNEDSSGYFSLYTLGLCESLESISVDVNNSQFSSIDGVLFDKNKITLYCYPQNKSDESYIIPSTVENVEESSIGFNKNLKKVVFSDSVLNLGRECLRGCSQLESIEFGKFIGIIPALCCYECPKLYYVKFPDNLKRIEDEAFSSCPNLTQVSIPGSVEYVGNLAFYNVICRFDGNAPSVGTEAFGPTNISSEESTLYYYSNKSGWSTPTWNGYATIPMEPISGTVIDQGIIPYSNVNWYLAEDEQKTRTLVLVGPGSIPDYAQGSFEKPANTPWKDLQFDKVVLKGSITRVGNNAFSYKDFSEIQINDELESMGRRSFEGCTFEEFYISDNLSSIDYLSLFNCKNLKKFTINNNSNFSVDDDGALYSTDKSIMYYYPSGNGKWFYKLNENTTILNNSCFNNCTSLQVIDNTDNVQIGRDTSELQSRI